MFLRKYGLFLAWLVALIAMISTLYASEVFHWPVCVLCWYQRIAIYPLVVLLGIAAFKNEKIIIPYALPFCVTGFLFGVYQYGEQMIPGFAPISFCTQGVPCSAIHFKLLGFITLPLLSAVGCGVIFCLLLFCRE
ncbi:MAG: disulfide bond formation protein B [Gammaproteobacteria bacterium]|nr:disulfide bond formation protein B [Gammaproteobacteria bacterium]